MLTLLVSFYYHSMRCQEKLIAKSIAAVTATWQLTNPMLKCNTLLTQVKLWVSSSVSLLQRTSSPFSTVQDSGKPPCNTLTGRTTVIAAASGLSQSESVKATHLLVDQSDSWKRLTTWVEVRLERTLKVKATHVTRTVSRSVIKHEATHQWLN